MFNLDECDVFKSSLLQTKCLTACTCTNFYGCKF